MEPRIQYAKTSDGVNIAYYVLGEGLPLVWTNLPTTHLQLEWQDPELRRRIEGVARVWTFVRYDSRGFGLSDQDVTDFSLDAFVRDLEAVADRLELANFDLIAGNFAVPIAIAYAARHTERLAHLVVYQGSARGVDLWNQELDELLALAEKNWELASQSIELAFAGWREPDFSRESAALSREALEPRTLLSLVHHARDWDVRGLLPQVTAPTLIVHPRARRYLDVATARELAADIPDARLIFVEGPYALSPEGQSAMVSFLLGRQAARGARKQTPDTAIILFADIADSTALTERLGDAAFREKARELDTALRTTIREHNGTAIEGKLVGDGVLAVFTSARQAIEAALACGTSGDDTGLPLHLGLHAGDVIREDDPDGRSNVYGGAVNIASRIAGLSAAGEVLVSETVRSLARTSAGVRFEDRGEKELKGVGEKVRVWAVVEAANQQTSKPANQDGA